MRTLTYHRNPCVLLSRLALVWLSVFSVALVADPCRGQTQQPAAAQPAGPRAYDVLPYKDREKERSNMDKLLRSQAPSATDWTTLQTYFEEYGLARWTIPARAHEVQRFRQDLRGNFRSARRSPQTYDQMNDLVLRMLGDMVQGNYNPVARYNAMLAIAGLNIREPARSTEKPVPLARALPLLLGAYNDPGQIDAVRIAALVGILRHVRLGIADSQVRNAQVLPVVLQLASANQAPKGRSAEGHVWFRVLAVKTLGALAVTGQQGEVANALGDVAADGASPLWVRCAAARCLGQLDYSDPAGIAPDSMLAKLTQLSAAICSQEADLLEKLKRDELIAGQVIHGPSLGGGMFDSAMGVEMGAEMERDTDMEEDMSMPGMDPSANAEEEDTMETRRINGSRRRLKDQFLSVLEGLGTNVKRNDGSRAGIHVLTTDPDQETLLTNLTAAIMTLLDALSDKEGLDSDTLDEAIATATDEIGQVLDAASTGPPAEPPAGTTPPPAIP